MLRSRLVVLASCTASVLLLTPAFAAKHGGNNSRPAPAAPPPQVTNNTATIQADQKDVDADKAALTKANKELNEAVEQSAGVVAAKKDVADATAELQAEADVVKKKLASDPNYKAAVAKETALRGQLDDLRNSNATQDQISDKAKEVFDAGSATSKMEQNADALDQKYVDAQKKLSDANAALTTARNAAKNDPAVTALKSARDDAQKKLADAQAKLDADRKPATASVSH
jgi:DNA repair exonuclease SbcCD ATPase subunit